MPVAEQLEEQYGVLPIQNWLIQNDFIGLNIARKKHPQLFAHIKQNKAGRSAKEWVAIARRLEKKHGILPIPSWLCKNGYSGLYAAIRQHPKLFARIKRNNRTERAAKKWITLAERLERKHGILPLHFWLQRNGYEGQSAHVTTSQALRPYKTRQPEAAIAAGVGSDRQEAEKEAWKNSHAVMAHSEFLQWPNRSYEKAPRTLFPSETKMKRKALRNTALFAHIKQKRLRK